MDQDNLNRMRNEEDMEIQHYKEQQDDQITIKYSKLLKKCEQIKMENFRLINYIDQINKLVRKVRKQNAFITNKLEQNNDEHIYKAKPSILNEIELVINYGKSKLKKDNIQNKVKFNLNKKDNEVPIDHKNKKIKIENKAADDNLLMNNITMDNSLSTANLTYPITSTLNNINST